MRTLQTIYPYAIYSRKKVNVEYGLSEYRHNPYFLIENQIYDISDIKDDKLLSIINDKYESEFKTEDYDYILLEFKYHLEERVKKFFNQLIRNKKNKNKCILIVSHKGVMNAIKEIYFNNGSHSEFHTGKIEIHDLVDQPIEQLLSIMIKQVNESS